MTTARISGLNLTVRPSDSVGFFHVAPNNSVKTPKQADRNSELLQLPLPAALRPPDGEADVVPGAAAPGGESAAKSHPIKSQRLTVHL